MYRTYTQTFEWIHDDLWLNVPSAKCIVTQTRDQVTGAVTEDIDFRGEVDGPVTTVLIDTPLHPGQTVDHFARIGPLPVMSPTWQFNGVDWVCVSTVFSPELEVQLEKRIMVGNVPDDPTKRITEWIPYGKTTPVVMRWTQQVSNEVEFPCDIFSEATGVGSDIDKQIDSIPYNPAGTDRYISAEGATTDVTPGSPACQVVQGKLPVCCVTELNSLVAWRGNDGGVSSDFFPVPDALGAWRVFSQPDCYYQWRWAYGKVVLEPNISAPFCLVGYTWDGVGPRILQDQAAGTVIGGMEWLRTICNPNGTIDDSNVAEDAYLDGGVSMGVWNACAYFQPDYPPGCVV